MQDDRISLWRGLAAAGLLAAGVLSAAAAAPQAAQAAEEVPAIEPEALAALRATSDLLKSARSLQFRMYTLREEADDAGQMLTMTYDERFTVLRPERLRVQPVGGQSDHSLWYDGKKVTLLDESTLYYASAPAPATIDATVSFLTERLGFPSLAEGMVLSDPYAFALDGLKAAYIVGEARIGETDCLHIAARDADVDWQIWIAIGDRPLPRRLAVTYTSLAGAPRVVSQFSEWRLDLDLSPDFFTFVPSPSAHQVDIELEPIPKN